MANVVDIFTPDGVVSVPEIEFTADQVSFFTKDKGAEGATSFLAENTANEISQQFPDLFNYSSLKDGTAKIFDLDPDLASKPANERGLTDEAILKQFTNLEEVGFFSGFGRELFKSGPSGAAFFAGAKTGAAVTSGIPPVNPLLVGVKFGVPVVTGTLAAFAAYDAGEDLSNFVFGDEATAIPSHRAAFEAGRTTAGGLAWLPLPFLISKNVSFGASTYLKNLDEIIKTGAPQTGLQRSKPPLSTKLISGVETLLNKTGQEFRDKPKRMSFLEGLSLSGATGGAYLAESIAPEEGVVRIPLEIAGGIGPQLVFGSIVKNFETIKDAVKKPFSAEGRKKMFQGTGLGKDKRQLDAVRRVREILNEQGDDVEGLIEALNDDTLTKQLGDLNLTAGQKTGNPTLMAIEARLASDSQGLGKTRNEAHKAANKAIRNLINALVATGDKTAIQEAAKLQKLRFDGYLAETLALKSERVLDAFKAVSRDGPINNKKLSQKLFEVTGSALAEARNQERSLYRNISNFEITSFVNTEGNPVDVPNFIRYFEENMPRTNEAYAEFLKDLGPLANFVNRKKIELGLDDLTPGQTANRLAEFDKVIEQIKARGVLPRRTDNLVLNEVDQARKELNFGELDELDAGQLTTLLTNIRNNKPVQLTDVFRGKQTKQDMATRQANFEQKKRYHKDALELVNTLRKRKLEEANIPVSEATDELKPLTVTEIRDMRSLALEKGRELTGANKTQKARVAFGFAEALLDDLNSAPQGINAAFDTARAYSKSLNDTYTRAFAGNILSKSKTGAERIAPEILHTKLFVGGADPSYLRITQIEEIGNFAKNQGLEGADETIATIHGTLDQLIRNARAEAFDPETGTVNVKKLQDWNRKNADLLDKFPGLKADLEEAEKANVLLNQWVDKDKRIQKIINSQKTYRNLTGYENPTQAVVEAINSRFPTKSLMSMIRVAKDNPEALAGLKSSILDAALVKAGGTSETFSPRALYETLFTKIPNAIDRNTTLMNIMLKNNVIKEGEANNFKKLIEEMVKLEAAESVGKLGEVIEGTGAIMDFYLRITGSAIGTRLQGLVFGGQGPGSLVAAGAGSKALRNLFNSIPESMKTDVMTEVMENPQLLATLLRKTKDQQQKQNIASKLKKILAKAGYIVIGKPVKESFRSAPFAIREIEEEEIDMTDPTFEGVGQQSSVDLPKAGFPTTQKATVPQSGVNARLAANVGTAPQAAPNPNQRQQFASLFPNDPISGLINAQQPPRLMAEGGDVPDLREAPEVDDLRALTLEEFKEATLKHLLDLQDQKDRAYEKYVAPKKGVILENVFGGSGIRLNPAFLEEAQQIEQEMRNFGIDRQKAIANYEDALREGKMVSMRSAKDIEQGNVIIRGFPDYLVNPVKNMQEGGSVGGVGLLERIQQQVADNGAVLEALQGGIGGLAPSPMPSPTPPSTPPSGEMPIFTPSDNPILNRRPAVPVETRPVEPNPFGQIQKMDEPVYKFDPSIKDSMFGDSIEDYNYTYEEAQSRSAQRDQKTPAEQAAIDAALAKGPINPIRQEYEKEVAAAKKMRQEGFLGRVVLPGEMGFDIFKSGYESRNSGMPQVTQLFANGGAAYDMGLEGDIAAQETIQSALESGSDDNQTQTQSFNFRDVPTTISRGIESLMGNIKYTPDVTGIQSFVRDTPVGITTPVSLQANIGGFPVSFTPTFQKGGLGVLAETTFANGGEVEDQFEDFDYQDAFGPASEFGSDVSEETKAENRYDDPDESIGDMYSLSPEQFTAMRGATRTNPFPDSLPSRIARFFGTDVDYTQQYGGGDAGLQRVAEINQLRQAQSLYPEDFTMKDFYEGQPTVRGPAVDVSNPITQGIRMLAPYGSGQIIPGDFLPREMAKERGLTAQQQKLIDLGMFNRFFGR